MDNLHPVFPDGDRNEIAFLLRSLGISRIESLSIVSLMDGAPRTSREIEQITGLRQPEVSIAMRPLCSTGIVETWDEKHDHSRGRPSRYYRLCVPLHEIIGFHERRLTTDFREKKEAIRQLKKMQ